MKKHIEGVHEKKKPNKCPVCIFSSYHKSALKNHIQSVHEGKKPYKCQYCNHRCSREQNLRTHVKSQHGISTVHDKVKPLKSNVESSFSTFVDKGGQRKHTENVHEKPQSPQRSVIEQNKFNDCAVCGKNFESSQDMKQHILFLHEKIKPSPDMSISAVDKEMDYEEEELGEDDHDEQDEHVHSEIKNEFIKLVEEKENNDDILDEQNLENPIESCKSTIQDKASQKLLTENVHERLKPVKVKIDKPKITKTCEICEKSFRSSKDLKQHISSVHGKIKAKPLPCPIESCKSTFKDKTTQRLHIEAVHECKKPYQCAECGVKFSFKSALNSHMRCVHEEKKSHKCPLCDTRFKVKGQVKVHVNTVHKQLNKSLCTLCGKGFSRIQALKRHVQAVHEGKKPYACPTCDKRFSLKCVMTSHVVAVHEKANPFTCSFCNLSFSRRHHLKTHITKFHEPQLL